MSSCYSITARREVCHPKHGTSHPITGKHVAIHQIIPRWTANPLISHNGCKQADGFHHHTKHPMQTKNSAILPPASRSHKNETVPKSKHAARLGQPRAFCKPGVGHGVPYEARWPKPHQATKTRHQPLQLATQEPGPSDCDESVCPRNVPALSKGNPTSPLLHQPSGLPGKARGGPHMPARSETLPRCTVLGVARLKKKVAPGGTMGATQNARTRQKKGFLLP